MQKAILITGGAGFIGSTLADVLIVQNTQVICLDNFDGFYHRRIKEGNIKSALGSPLYTLIEGDVRNKETLETIFKKYPIDTVIHLAAKVGIRPSILNPAEYLDVNVNGTLNVLEAMGKFSVKKMIFASSSSIYGDNERIPYSEADNTDHPISPYAASKKSGELLTHTYHHLYDLDIVNLRFFTVYGPRQRPDLAIHKFFKNIYTGAPIELYGDGSTARDYTYVDDIVKGIVSAIDYLEVHDNIYETINLGNQAPVYLSDLISLIESETGRKFDIKKMPAQTGDVHTTHADISKAQNLLGYQPETPLSEGLGKFKKCFETEK